MNSTYFSEMKGKTRERLGLWHHVTYVVGEEVSQFSLRGRSPVATESPPPAFKVKIKQISFRHFPCSCLFREVYAWTSTSEALVGNYVWRSHKLLYSLVTVSFYSQLIRMFKAPLVICNFLFSAKLSLSKMLTIVLFYALCRESITFDALTWTR